MTDLGSADYWSLQREITRRECRQDGHRASIYRLDGTEAYCECGEVTWQAIRRSGADSTRVNPSRFSTDEGEW